MNDPSPDFTIEGLLPGAYLVRMIGGGLVKSVVWNGKDYAFTPIEVTGSGDITGVVVTVTDATTTLSGVVRDATGQPAANAAVIYFPAEREQWTHFGIQPTRLRSSPVSTTGTFALRSLPAGNYFIVAVDDDQMDAWKDPAFLEAASRVATRVTLDWGETKIQDLIQQRIR